jgi:4-hydroxybenzoate polyprenyltransferase
LNESLRIATEWRRTKAWIVVLRPAHWIKNLLVAAPMVFGHAVPTPSLLFSLASAFVICSLAASAGYLTNDLIDREADRAHVRKRFRPVALGLISPLHALLAAVVFSVAAMALAHALFSPAMTALVAMYLVLTATYSRWLKRLPIFDVLVLASLFSLRLLVGGEASDIVVSGWLLAFGFSLFLALALAKRLDEVIAYKGHDARRVPGRPYGQGDAVALRWAMTVSALASVAILVAYVGLRGGDVYLYRQPEWLWLSVGLLALWLAHMLRRANSGSLHGDPIVIAASDPISLLLAAGVAATLIAAV